MNYKFTIFTPTFNRATLLCRLYNSILNQTYKNFVWLVIDDGSTDDTKKIVENWINDNIIKIIYIYKKNEGKHIALKMAFDIISTEYMLDIDSDDELTPNCLEVFNDEWIRIEKEGKKNINSIRALVKDDFGKIIGTYKPKRDKGYLDISFNEMHFLKHRAYENITSNKTDIIKQAKIFDTKSWLQDKIKNINPGLFWMRLANYTDTRYLFVVLRLYHYDAPESLIRVKSNHKQMWLNRFITIKTTIEEFSFYFWQYPTYFIKDFIYMGIYAKALNINTKEYLNNTTNKYMKYYYILLLPIFKIGALILKFKTNEK